MAKTNPVSDSVVQTFVIHTHVNRLCEYPTGTRCRENCKMRERFFVTGPFGKAEWHAEGSWSFMAVDGQDGANFSQEGPLDEATAVTWCAFGMDLPPPNFP